MDRFKLLLEVIEYVGLVVKLKDNDEHDHVNGEEQQDDEHEFEDDLGAQSHFGPLSGHKLLALRLEFLLFSLFLGL